MKLHVALAVLAATSLLRADPRPIDANQQTVTPTRTLEGFVPNNDGVSIASIELRPAASISGNGEVTLRQVCRWPASDDSKFAAVADLVVLRLAPGAAFATIDAEQIQTALGDAGLGGGAINFSGAMSCTVSRTDVAVDEGEALRRWVAGENATGRQTRAQTASAQPQRQAIPPQPATIDPAHAATQSRVRTTDVAIDTNPTPAPIPTPTPAPSFATSASQNPTPTDAQLSSATPADPQPISPPVATDSTPAIQPQPASIASADTGDLRAMLVRDIAARTHLPVNRLQIDFQPQDRALLTLAAPVQFTIQPQRYGDLGETSWFITINAGANATRKVCLRATARAWVDQVVLKRTVNLKEAIGADDVEVKHVLVDRLTADLLASADGAVGKQAARELQAGTVLSSRMIAPLELVRVGQTVTIAMRRGSIQIRSVATALQAGSLGQTVRVRNPTTNEVYNVQLTGPQTATIPGSDPVADASN